MSFGLVGHFFNEELLIPHFIEHYQGIVDQAILINHQSTDSSYEIIRTKAPNWKIVNTQLSDFNAKANDEEVEYWETQLRTTWKWSSNITEFLFIPNIKDTLKNLEIEYPNLQAFGVRTVCLVDKEQNLAIEKPIWKNRIWGYINYDAGIPVIRRWRYLHKASSGKYFTGRHGTRLSSIDLENLLLLHFTYSPWPECVARKLGIQTRIPESDKNQGLGFEHIVTEKELIDTREKHLKRSYNLLTNDLYRLCYNKFLGDLD